MRHQPRNSRPRARSQPTASCSLRQRRAEVRDSSADHGTHRVASVEDQAFAGPGLEPLTGLLNVIPACLWEAFDVAPSLLQSFPMHSTIRADDFDRTKVGMVLGCERRPAFANGGRPRDCIEDNTVVDREIVVGQCCDHVVPRPSELISRDPLTEESCLQVIQLDMEERTSSCELARDGTLAHTGQTRCDDEQTHSPIMGWREVSSLSAAAVRDPDHVSGSGGEFGSARGILREDRDVQFHFDPDTYLAMIRQDLPVYDEIQLAVGEAAAGGDARRILDLGAGTGETSRAVLEHHPTAALVLMDESPEMLAAARFVLGDDQIGQAVVGDLLGPLPDGPFDLVVSALAIHHLRGGAKRDLFFRLRPLLGPTGRFVMADVVVPEDPDDAVTPLSEGFDHPSSLPELLGWLEDAAFAVSVAWSWKDVVVLRCDVR